MAVRLCDLLDIPAGLDDLIVKRLVVDSRAVMPGDLFVAMQGSQVDGRAFIMDACAKGAAAILTTPGGAPTDCSVPVIVDRDVRARYAQLAAKIAGPMPNVQVAVTGTNGKTSVADFVRQIWCAMNMSAGSLGTLGAISGPVTVEGAMTTLEPMALHTQLADFARAGVTHVALEASSHGLHQKRLDGCQLKAGGFTNLTRDHLDYHINQQSYFDAKARLFRDLLPDGGGAVVMLTDEWADRMADVARGRQLDLITVGDGRAADFAIRATHPTSTGQDLTVDLFGRDVTIQLPLMGDFQGHNWLTALALVVASGSALDVALATASTMRGVAGRMDLRGQSATGGAVYVDYAHTPDGLQVVLQAARTHLRPGGKLHLVFGCGGDRDRGKRPQMGRIAASLADRVIVTDDNPRSENSCSIRAEIMAGVKGTTSCHEVGDRATAIAEAIDALGADDILIVAGKGHETGQTIGKETLDYSDLQTVDGLIGGQSR